MLERMLAARHHCERRTRNAGRTTDTSKRGVGFYRRVRESQTVSLSEKKKKSTAKMAIDTGSDDDDSCRTTKILTVYVGLVGTGKKGPVTGDKAVHNDEL